MCKTIKQTQEWKMYLSLLSQYRKSIKKKDNLAAQSARKRLDAFILTNILLRNILKQRNKQASKQKK